MAESSSYLSNSFLDSRYHEDQFLRVELRTGLLFSQIALGARHQAKRDRNRANARRAYDALLYFLGRIPSTEFAGSDAMTDGLAQLKSELQRLGEEL